MSTSWLVESDTIIQVGYRVTEVCQPAGWWRVTRLCDSGGDAGDGWAARGARGRVAAREGGRLEESRKVALEVRRARESQVRTDGCIACWNSNK